MRTASPTPIKKDPPYFVSKIAALAKQASLLSRKTEFTERDVSQADDYTQQYINILDEILDSKITIKSDVVVVVDKDDKIKFNNADAFLDWLTEHV